MLIRVRFAYVYSQIKRKSVYNSTSTNRRSRTQLAKWLIIVYGKNKFTITAPYAGLKRGPWTYHTYVIIIYAAEYNMI